MDKKQLSAGYEFAEVDPSTKYVAISVPEEVAPPQPIVHDMTYPMALPSVGIPTQSQEIPKPSFLVRTLRLVPFHVLNFVLGTVAFSVLLTDVTLCGCLIIIYIGIPMYRWSIPMIEYFADADVRIAGSITYGPREHRLASRLDRVSCRSTAVVIYFLTVKFGIGIMSCVAVLLPILPIASQIVHMSIDEGDVNYTAGWNCNAFNWDSHPLAYTFVVIGYFIGGVLIMHLFAKISREATRAVCAERTTPAPPAMM